jgi:predicted RNA-binding Zn ribbon-like protein
MLPFACARASASTWNATRPGAPGIARAYEKLNESLEAMPFVVHVSSGKPTMTMQPVQPDALAGLGAVVNQLYDASASGELDRLKMCASEDCRRVFYDRSKPGTRRWCQASLCGNRMKTRAYRERHKT